MAAKFSQARRTLPERRVVAVFDLDGTLTASDTLFPFLRFAVGTGAFLLRLPLALPVLAAMALGILSRNRAKQLVLAIFLRGQARADLLERGETFARGRMKSMMRRQAMERVSWHLSRGHHCVLASASLAPYVEPWARIVGFDDVFATQLEYDARGRATGRIEGQNCRGEEKLKRLRTHFGDLSALAMHGYGDSPADRAFLDQCTEANYRPFRGDSSATEWRSDGKVRNRPADFLKLMRPHQWVKNGFVFIGLLFGHAWAVPELVLGALLVAAGFCLTASAIYIVNDCADRERDLVHPKKRHRPIAAGKVTPHAALILAGALAFAGLALAFAASPIALAVVGLYAAMNLAYSFLLKGVVILDVFIIAAGFILRILAGTLGIGVLPSQWLLVCSLFLTLFLGFTKRRSELLSVGADFIIHRKALLHYSPALLDKMISICASAAIISYSLYTMSPTTVRLHGTENLIYTIPFVVYGMFRYLYLLHAKHAGGDASSELVRDPHLAMTVLGWAGATAWLIT
jgi:HAD-superfamily subfamily IB hydrolase, TIGR01490